MGCRGSSGRLRRCVAGLPAGGVRGLSGGCLHGPWRMLAWSVEDACTVCGGCLHGPWRMQARSGRRLAGAVSGCLRGAGFGRVGGGAEGGGEWGGAPSSGRAEGTGWLQGRKGGGLAPVSSFFHLHTTKIRTACRAVLFFFAHRAGRVARHSPQAVPVQPCGGTGAVSAASLLNWFWFHASCGRLGGRALLTKRTAGALPPFRALGRACVPRDVSGGFPDGLAKSS